MEAMRKITISIDPPKSMEPAFDFSSLVKERVQRFLVGSAYEKEIDDGSIVLNWFNDFPTSNGVAVTIQFRVLDGVDLAGELSIALRKTGYEIRGVHVGY